MRIPLASIFACLFLLHTCMHSYTHTHTRTHAHTRTHIHMQQTQAFSFKLRKGQWVTSCQQLNAPLDDEQPKYVLTNTHTHTHTHLCFSFCRETTLRLNVHTGFALNFITSQNVQDSVLKVKLHFSNQTACLINLHHKTYRTFCYDFFFSVFDLMQM